MDLRYIGQYDEVDIVVDGTFEFTVKKGATFHIEDTDVVEPGTRFSPENFEAVGTTVVSAPTPPPDDQKSVATEKTEV